MKKTLVVASMLAMLPCAAHAKSMITDNGLDGVTGQAGVSIDMDVRFDVNADTVAWGQKDGSGNTSWIGMKNFTIDNMTVKLRPDILGAVTISTLMDQMEATHPGMTDAQAAGALKLGGAQAVLVDAVVADRGQGVTTANFIAQAAPMTIDVLTADTATGNKAAGTTFVRIGLGSLEIAANNIDFTVGLGKTTGNSAPAASDLSQELGAMHVGNLAIELSGQSTVDIYSTQKLAGQNYGSGVVFDLNVIIDKMTAGALSWGNTTNKVTGTSTSALSAQADASAGYVGLANLNINNLRLTGPVSIQVATVSTDAATAGQQLAAASLQGLSSAAFKTALSNYYYSLYNSVSTPMGSSFVHIGLGTGNSLSGSTLDGSTTALGFSMGSLIADVKVANNADLTGGGTYGTMGINNLKVGMNGWVNIGTH